MERGVERIGTTIRGKYRIDSVIGVGGMAVVYAATHRNKKRFAIKMLHPEISVVAAIRDRFLREGYVANTVDHPGAVAVLDEDVAEDGAAFLVMELLHGAPVDAIWEARGKRLPVSVVLAITVQFLDILKAAHDKSIVHRDLKPANLFLTREGTVKILDFGIARLRDTTSMSSGSTQSGAMMGTPAYLPPEQAGGRTREIDGQTDLWAVGATMFALLSGEMVHEGENAPQVVIASATKPARSLASVLPDAPPLVVDLVARALAFEKSERWPTAAAMQNAVRSTYKALFNADVTSERLADLVAGISRSDTPSVEPIQGSATELMTPTPGTPAQAAAAAASNPSSTNAPVSATGGGRGRVRTPSLVIAAVVGVLCVGIGVGAFLRYRSAAAGDAKKDEPASFTPAVSITPNIPPPPQPSSTSPESIAIPPTPSTTASAASVASAVAVAVAHPTQKPTVAKPSATASTKPPANCDPPYTVDPQNGKHIYKKECL